MTEHGQDEGSSFTGPGLRLSYKILWPGGKGKERKKAQSFFFFKKLNYSGKFYKISTTDTF